MFVITFTKNGTGSTPVILGDDGANPQVWVSNFDSDGSTREQVAAYLRGKEVQIFDRGNFMSVITWTSSRQFASYALCVQFITKHRQDLIGIGTLLVNIAGTILSIPKAKVMCGKPRWNGIHAFLDYTAKGGLIV